MAMSFFKGGYLPFPTSTGSAAVTGVGFSPQAVIFLWTNAATEDVWLQNTAGAVGGGIGQASIRNTVTADLSILQASYHEIWTGNQIGSRFSNKAISMKAARLVAGAEFEASLSSFDADGFTLNVTTAAPGARHLYWLAIGNMQDIVSAQWNAGLAQALGFFPDAFFLIGEGGTADFPRDYLSSTWLKAGIGGFNPTYSAMGLGRGVFGYDPQQWNIQHGTGGGHFPDFELLVEHTEPWVFGANISIWDEIQYGPDLVSVDFRQGGFSESWHDMFVLSGVSVDGGSTQVVSAADTPQTVFFQDPVFVPACIFLFGPQYGFNWGGSNVGQSFGFRTDDFECCVAWGGQNGGTASRFTSRNRSWVSGFEPFGSVAPISSGQTDLGTTPGQFTMTPKVSDNTNKQVWWEAFQPGTPILPTVISASKNAYPHKTIEVITLRS